MSQYRGRVGKHGSRGPRIIRSPAWRRSSIAQALVWYYALFGIIVGLLYVISSGLIKSSWYCVVIAFIGMNCLIVQMITKDKTFGFFFFPLVFYIFVLSVLWRINSHILIGGLGNILIFTCLSVLVIIFLYNMVKGLYRGR